MRQQNVSNHRFFEPTTYFFLLPLVLVLAVGLVLEWSQFLHDEQGLWQTVSMTALQLTVIILAVRIRLYALIAQDRAIRAEEQIRHVVLTGQMLDTRLSIQQIVALRFAGDEEFVSLAKRAADEQMTPQNIKLAIKDWRADWHRV